MDKIVVVGGGPAGLTAAAVLAGAGLDVWVLERENYPRAKPCGGAVSSRAAVILDDVFPGWRGTVRGISREVAFFSGCSARIVRRDLPIAYLVDRSEFDSFLAKAAGERGASIYSGHRVERCSDGAAFATVEAAVRQPGTRHRWACTFPAEYVLIAAGQLPPAVQGDAKSGGGRRGFRVGMTLSGEVARPAGFSAACCTVDTGVVRDGYGWAFPRGDKVSIGVGTMRSCVLSDLRSAAELFCRRQGLSVDGVRLRAWPIPVGGEVAPRGRARRIMWLGDSAGLVSPLTGEGIFYALLSGHLAARAILSGTGRPVWTYDMLVRRGIWPELRRHWYMSKAFYTWPAGMAPLLKRVKVI